MYTSDAVRGMAADLVAAPGSLGFEALNLVPRKLEGINLDYLRVFRSGGYDFGSEVNA